MRGSQARLVLALAVVVCWGIRLSAQLPVSHETVQVTQASASSLATTTINPAGIGQISTCEFSVENGPVRVWVDGTSPTSTTGHWFAAGAHVLMTSYDVARRFQVIAVLAASTLQVTCVKGGPGQTPSTPLVVAYDPNPVGGPCNALLKAAGVCK